MFKSSLVCLVSSRFTHYFSLYLEPFCSFLALIYKSLSAVVAVFPFCRKEYILAFAQAAWVAPTLWPLVAQAASPLSYTVRIIDVGIPVAFDVAKINFVDILVLILYVFRRKPQQKVNLLVPGSLHSSLRCVQAELDIEISCLHNRLNLPLLLNQFHNPIAR